MRTARDQSAAGLERAEVRFERLYAEHGRAVLAYAVRRAADAQDAADVVADTFLVAWRRLDDVPPAGAARLWLYGVARHVLANQQRSERRRERLAERLRHELPGALEGVPPPAYRRALSGPRSPGWDWRIRRSCASAAGRSSRRAR
jgi:RNA polymerase sigma factor (sigma-70 family)